MQDPRRTREKTIKRTRAVIAPVEIVESEISLSAAPTKATNVAIIQACTRDIKKNWKRFVRLRRSNCDFSIISWDIIADPVNLCSIYAIYTSAVYIIDYLIPIFILLVDVSVMSSKKATKGTEGINSKLQLVIKSGKYTLGLKSTLKTLRSGKAKLLMISSNCPALRRSELEYYAMLAKTDIYHYPGNNIDLGTSCGKFYRVSVMAITDAGDSDILSITEA